MKIKSSLLLFIVLNLFSLKVSSLYAADTLSKDAKNTTSTEVKYEGPVEEKSVSQKRSRLEDQLSVSVLLFGLFLILIEFFLIRSKNFTPHHSTRLILLTLIITSTLFLITAGYDNNQIAPAIGLLGTIAGYLLGRSQNDFIGETTKQIKK